MAKKESNWKKADDYISRRRTEFTVHITTPIKNQIQKLKGIPRNCFNWIKNKQTEYPNLFFIIEKIILLILSAIIAYTLVLILWAFSTTYMAFANAVAKDMSAILANYFGTDTINNFKIAICIALILILPIFWISGYLTKIFKINAKWVIFTILIGAGIFIFGTYALQIVYQPQLNLNFKNCSDTSTNIGYSLTCADNAKVYLVNSTQECKFISSQNISDLNVILNMSLINGSIANSTNNNSAKSWNFTAPADAYFVQAKFTANITNNTPICGDSSTNFHFLTKEEYYQNRKDFATYFLALIGAIIITIPSAMLTFKNLANK